MLHGRQTITRENEQMEKEIRLEVNITANEDYVYSPEELISYFMFVLVSLTFKVDSIRVIEP